MVTDNELLNNLSTFLIKWGLISLFIRYSIQYYEVGFLLVVVGIALEVYKRFGHIELVK